MQGLCLLAFVFFALSIFSSTASPESQLVSYTGKVADSEIHMKLPLEEVGLGKMDGSYSYDAYDQPILLEGEVSSGRITLKELDESNKQRATFSGIFVSPYRIEGVWFDKDAAYHLGDRPHAFYIQQENAPVIPAPPANLLWNGIRERDSGRFSKSTLTIMHTTGNTFWFYLQTFSGSHTGGIAGLTTISGNHAVFNDYQGGQLDFYLSEDDVLVKQNDKMSIYGGMGVGFSGRYLRNKVTVPLDQEYTFTNFKILTQEQEQLFRNLTGSYYVKFQNTAHYCTYLKDLDGFDARVYGFNVRGMFGYLESIIMVRDSDNTFWSAALENNKVYYFTNASDSTTLPATIEKWRAGFKKYPVILSPDNA